MENICPEGETFFFFFFFESKAFSNGWHGGGETEGR